MFKIVVVFIPYSNLPLKISWIFESVLLIELLLIFSMASLHRTILRRFARVNKIMNNIVLCTETIQRMKCLYRHITAFIRTKIVVCESGVIVSLDGLYYVWEPLHNLSKKSYIKIIKEKNRTGSIDSIFVRIFDIMINPPNSGA